MPPEADAGDATAFSEADFNVSVYLSNYYGPQRQPPEKLIPLTIAYIGMRATGENDEGDS